MNESDVVGTLLGCFLLLTVVFVVVAVWWKIIAKTGHPAALALLMVVPLANLLVMLFLAFSRWPVVQRVEELEKQLMEATFD